MVSLFFSLALAASPCGPLDLPTALRIAAQRSDEVAIKQADVATAEVDQALARSLAILPVASATLLVGPDPAAHGTITSIPGPAPAGASPSVAAQYTGNTNRELNSLGVFERIDITGIQPLWTWGQLSGARDAAKAGLRARELLVDDTLSQIQLRVIQLFWADALARRFIAIAQDVQKNLAQVDAQLAKSLKEEKGDVSPADKYQVALFRSELDGRMAEAVRGQELARIGLAATLALPRDRLQLKEIDLSQSAAKVPSLDKALEEADRRADLRALSAAIDAKRAEVQIKEGALLPTLFIGGTFSYAYAYNRSIQLNPWVSDYFNTLSVGAAFGLREDLSLATLIAQKNKAKSELVGIERQRDGLRRLIDTQVESAVAELTAALARLKASQDGLSAGRAWFHSAGLDFEAGVGDAKGLLTAYKGYVESQVNAAQASYDVLVTKAKLDQAMAVPLADQQVMSNGHDNANPGGGDDTCTLY